MGDKIRAARISLGMSQAELSRRTGLTSRAIRYYESNNRTPTVDAIKKVSEALGLSTDYFIDDAAFQEQLEKEAFLAEAQEKYGSRGKAQAKRIAEETRALYAGGELSEAELISSQTLPLHLAHRWDSDRILGKICLTRRREIQFEPVCTTDGGLRRKNIWNPQSLRYHRTAGDQL